MSKVIVSSLQRFQNHAQPLGKRQSGGAMPKRITQGLDIAARRLLIRETFKLGGIVGEFARRGYENVFDSGAERLRLYCLKCGTMAKDNDESCRICNKVFIVRNKIDSLTPALSPDKFEIKCLDCKLHFYKVDRMQSNEQDFVSAVGYRSDICTCFVDARKAYTENLRRDRRNRKIYLDNKNKPRKDEKKTEYRKELDTILMKDKNELSRAQKRELSQRKVILMRLLNM